jgi:cytochrome c553
MNLRQPWPLGPAGGLLAWRSLRAPPTGSRPGQGSVYQTCYGLDGAGRMPEVPNIAGDIEIYLAKQLKGYRSGERRHEQMSIIAASLSEDQIADLAAYYASIKGAITVPEC